MDCSLCLSLLMLDSAMQATPLAIIGGWVIALVALFLFWRYIR